MELDSLQDFSALAATQNLSPHAHAAEALWANLTVA